ncbi:MAG: GTP-binding protein [Ruminococcus sp.]|nr:GTP-binding protein [Ruminococcus sp.]
MGNPSENRKKETEQRKKQICLGILAHVDAGKTTLSESLLYVSGEIRKPGRVDNRDAFLDTFDLERERGITIFSKQAVFSAAGTRITLVDTPGHVDFSAEMERTLQVLDAAVLVISGADGVQGHTETLWKLLSRYRIPTFLFVNKMDQQGTDAGKLLAELKKRLHENCVDFGKERGDSGEQAEFLEDVAMCEEAVLEAYVESGTVETTGICRLIAERKLFPCYFGSALKLTGVEEFLAGLVKYVEIPSYPELFGAKIYKISRDERGERLTHLKVTGGKLQVKDLLTNRGGEQKILYSGKRESSSTGNEEGYWEEKVNQIRIYSGAKYETVGEAAAGTICAVAGLTKTMPGQGLGIESASEIPVLEPVLTYRILLPPDCDASVMLQNLRLLEEEEPLLHIVWQKEVGEIHAQLMGEVQIEVLRRVIWDRFQVQVEFDMGSIVYKETIAAPVEGVGHFEPLRHYAEVHLLLEPGEPDSGLQFFSRCSEDVLDRNWQRLILTHLEEKVHVGVLTGSAVTDMRITLAAGRAHQKHTEGGDFRQATYRALRQGLKKAESILLEPYYEYRLEVPTEVVGRSISDLQRMQGTFSTPETEGEMSILQGMAPVSTMRDYQTEVQTYTRGRGRLFCMLLGYRPCHNTEEVVEQIGYDSERDLANPTGSVFCAHGAGFVVKWDQVEAYMHLENQTGKKQEEEKEPEYGSSAIRRASRVYELSAQEEKELERMAEAARRKREQAQGRKKFSYKKAEPERQPSYTGKREEKCGSTGKRAVCGLSGKNRGTVSKEKERKEYLLVDGYNIIFAWKELQELAEVNMDSARRMLMDILSNYQGRKGGTLILVFDAYKLEGFPGEVETYHNIYVVYTKEAETADQYIEKVAHEIGHQYDVTVATSDGTEQVIIRGQGCRLLSAKELWEEIALVNQEIREKYLEQPDSGKNYLFRYLDKETAREMERVRLGKRKEEKRT